MKLKKRKRYVTLTWNKNPPTPVFSERFLTKIQPPPTHGTVM